MGAFLDDLTLIQHNESDAAAEARLTEMLIEIEKPMARFIPQY